MARAWENIEVATGGAAPGSRGRLRRGRASPAPSTCTPSADRWASSPAPTAFNFRLDGCPMWMLLQRASCAATRCAHSPARRETVPARLLRPTWLRPGPGLAPDGRLQKHVVQGDREAVERLIAQPDVARALSFVGSTPIRPGPSTRAGTHPRGKRVQEMGRRQEQHVVTNGKGERRNAGPADAARLGRLTVRRWGERWEWQYRSRGSQGDGRQDPIVAANSGERIGAHFAVGPANRPRRERMGPAHHPAWSHRRPGWPGLTSPIPAGAERGRLRRNGRRRAGSARARASSSVLPLVGPG